MSAIAVARMVMQQSFFGFSPSPIRVRSPMPLQRRRRRPMTAFVGGSSASDGIVNIGYMSISHHRGCKRKRADDANATEEVQFHPIPRGYDLKSFFEPSTKKKPNQDSDDSGDGEYVIHGVSGSGSLNRNEMKIDWRPVKPGSLKAFFDSCKKPKSG